MSTVTASAPGRVNLIGEHLDYNGGLCLPIAIDRRTTATVRFTDGPAHVLRSDVSPAGWERYVLGVLNEMGVRRSLDVSVRSTVPIGAGLSSSAALTCSVGLAANELNGAGLDRYEILSAALTAENTYAGAPTGGMDQAASLFGEPGHAVLVDCIGGSLELVPWAPEADGLSILVIDTGVHHTLDDGCYADRRTDCERAAAELGVEYLALAPAGDVCRLADERLRARARHVISEQARVRDAVTAVTARRWHTVGALMNASHASLRDDFEVSCPELDTAVAAALGAGALGARMTGGGFGGSAIALVPTDLAETVAHDVTQAFARNGWEAPTVFPVRASRGASVDQVT